MSYYYYLFRGEVGGGLRDLLIDSGCMLVDQIHTGKQSYLLCETTFVWLCYMKCRVSDCYLTPNEQFFSYTMARTSYIYIR